jgi:hypothetical protein
MKKHRVFIRYLVFWHIFISAFALILYGGRLTNARYEGVELKNYSDYLYWYGINGYLVLIAVVAVTSAILLVIKKPWGRISSIMLGSILLPFGLFLFYSNLYVFLEDYGSFFFKLYHFYFGASVGYIDLVCIGYGIFAIIYFTRKKIKIYLTQTSTVKEQTILES